MEILILIALIILGGTLAGAGLLLFLAWRGARSDAARDESSDDDLGWG